MSYAFMLLETSRAITTSTPFLFTSSSFVPIWGPQIPKIKKLHAMIKKMRRIYGLDIDTSGNKSAIRDGSPNLLSAFFFQCIIRKKIIMNTGISAYSSRNSLCAKRNKVICDFNFMVMFSNKYISTALQQANTILQQ